MPDPQVYIGDITPAHQQTEKVAKSDTIKYVNGRSKVQIEANASNKTAIKMIVADFILQWVKRLIVPIVAIIGGFATLKEILLVVLL